MRLASAVLSFEGSVIIPHHAPLVKGFLKVFLVFLGFWGLQNLGYLGVSKGEAEKTSQTPYDSLLLSAICSLNLSFFVF